METGNALPKLNDSLLERYIHNFYGYGDLESDFWFISLEEAGLDSPDREEQFQQIQKRIDLWEKRGYRKLEDCRSFYLALSVSKSNEWFSEDPKIQQTWKIYIRILFNFKENKEFIEGDKKQQIKLLKNYQKSQLGKKDGNMCMMEISPLPAPGTDSWPYPYKNCSNLDFLKTRPSCMKYLDSFRIDEIKNEINKHKPKFVFFLGLTKKEQWLKIIGEKRKREEKSDDGKAYIYNRLEKKETTYFITPHATQAGWGDADFDRLYDFYKTGIPPNIRTKNNEIRNLLTKHGYTILESDKDNKKLSILTPDGKNLTCLIKTRAYVKWDSMGGKNLYLIFPDPLKNRYYLIPHDKLFDILKSEHGHAPKWSKFGGYWSTPISKKLHALIREYQIGDTEKTEQEIQ